MNERPLGYISVVGKDDKIVHTESVWKEKAQLFEVYCEQWPTGVDKGETFVFIPEAFAKFRKAIPLSCLFSSVETYVKNLLGVGLDYSDRTFFELHPLTGRSGVSQANTLRVAQEIVDPYDLRISRVVVKPGTMLTGDLKQWMNVLGINPLALADRTSSNAKFAEVTGLPLEDANRMFRFEFREGLLRPAISCGAHETKKGERPLGHASYEAPRSRYDNSIIQFQIGRGVNWDKDPVFGDVEPVDQERDLEAYNSLAKDGRPMYEHLANKNIARGSLSAGAQAQKTRMVHGPQAGSTLVGPVGQQQLPKRKPIRDCHLCGSSTGDRVGANCCVRCWILFCKEISCGHCGITLSYQEDGTVWYPKGYTLFRRGPDWFFKIKCQACDSVNEITCVKGSIANAIQKAMRGESIEDEVSTPRDTQGVTH